MSTLKIKVVSEVCPGCERGFKKGQTWEMEGNLLPGGMCVGGMSALLPWITCALYKADLPWVTDGKIQVNCTDPDHPVTFEIFAEKENQP